MYLPVPNSLLTHLPRLQRLATAAFAGLCASVGLLWMMTQLIQTDGNGYEEKPPITLTDWVRVPEEPLVINPIRKIEPPKVVSEPEVRPVAIMDFGPSEFGGDTVVPPKATDGQLTIGPGLADGNAIPVVLVQPQYPQRALARGIEGYVVVGFDIAPSGAVVNPEVIEASPPGVFDRAALNAVKKFKYKPKVIDQRAVATGGLLHRIVFELEDS